MKKLLFPLLAGVLALGAVSSCKKSAAGGIVLTGGQTEYTLWADGNTVTGGITFKTTGAWTSTVTEGVGPQVSDVEARWVRIGPIRGERAGSHAIGIWLETNYTGSDRSATIILFCDDDHISIRVTQKATVEGGGDPIANVTEVELDRAQLIMNVGDTEILKATIAPENATNKAVTWSSSNEAIVKVDATGRLTAMGVGRAQITVTTVDGGKTAQCQVLVGVPDDVLSLIPSYTLLIWCTAQMGEWDKNGDGKLSPGEAAVVTSIEIQGGYLGQKIVHMTGIEYFTGLVWLGCSDNQIAALDVSKNTALKTLYCGGNELTSLDISKNTRLATLSCQGNRITSLDLSNNTALAALWCYDNPLTSLDISQNSALGFLNCGGDLLSSLDVSKNPALERLYCNGNSLVSLDVSNSTALTVLECSSNPGNGKTFPVKAWFDNSSIPKGFSSGTTSWTYGGKTITIDYQKAN